MKIPKIQAPKSSKPPSRRSLPKIKAVVSETCALVGEGNERESGWDGMEGERESRGMGERERESLPSLSLGKWPQHARNSRPMVECCPSGSSTGRVKPSDVDLRGCSNSLSYILN